MKRLILGIILFFQFMQHIIAGDIANFVNLGFSNNARYFMFAQYGIEEKYSTPYAELYVVNVPLNTFAANGKKELRSEKSVEPGDNGIGALFALLDANHELTKQYAVNHLSRGRILYLLIDGEKPRDVLQFRDFNTDKKYTVTLVQKATGSGKELKSSFYIDAVIARAEGKEISLKIGSPNYQRAGVKNYRIRQIIVAPDEKSLVFLIEKEEKDTDGVNIRYMVETAKTE